MRRPNLRTRDATCISSVLTWQEIVVVEMILHECIGLQMSFMYVMKLKKSNKSLAIFLLFSGPAKTLFKTDYSYFFIICSQI